jgi:cell wall-associated NlpC family hydrolase
MKLDKRLIPARPDIAAAYLRGQVEAAQFVTGEVFEVRDSAAALRREPRPDGALDSELLFGEGFTVYETDEEGWCWGQSTRDAYVGYIARNALQPSAPKTHRIAALGSFLYPGPSIKLPPIAALSLNALLGVERQAGDFLIIKNRGCVWAGHAVPLDVFAPDFVRVAEQFLHVPYLWGGRTRMGVDCSGLVQLALQACGQAAPRDSDMQKALGAPVTGALQRGDLVFWTGHVGIMQSESQLLHANGHFMCVTSESLDVARVRILEKGGGEVTGVRRL